MPLRRIFEELGGGLREAPRSARLQVGGPLGASSARRSSTCRSPSRRCGELGAALGHGSLIAIDERIVARRCCAIWGFAASESCGTCAPCRLGTRRGLERAEGRGGADVASRFDELLETMSAAACARSAAASRPSFRSLAGLRCRRHEAEGRGRPVTVRRAPVCWMRPGPAGARCRRCAATTAPRPVGSCRTCLVASRRGGRSPPAPRPPPRGVDAHRRPGRADDRRLRARADRSELPERALDRAGAQRAGPRPAGGSASSAAAFRRASPPSRDESHPYVKLRPRPLHRLRALRADVRRGAGDVRARAGRPGRRHGRCAGARRRLDATRTASPAAAASTAARPARCRSVGLLDLRPIERTTTTTCGYCGVGCTLDVHVRDGEVAAITPNRDAPGQPRPRLREGPIRARLRRARPSASPRPLLRRDGELRRGELGRGARPRRPAELRRIRDEHGPDAIAAISSARATNEENYLMQKLMRVVIGTNNVDNCSRICHAPSAAGLVAAFGLLGRHQPLRRLRPRRLLPARRLQPDRGPSGGRRADQAAGDPRAPAGRGGPAADRAGRATPTSTCGPAGLQRRGLQRAGPTAARGGLRRRATSSPTRATGSTSCARCSTSTRPSRSSRSPAYPAATCAARRASTARPAGARSSTASGSPSTRTAPTACARWRTWRS